MRIRYIDGIRLKRAIIAGGRRLIQSADYLNKINVFPVPDSDTGTNMAGTIASVIRELSTRSNRSVAITSKTVADAALVGARGNSGAILAQFFHGLSKELHDQMVISAETFGRKVDRAVDYAYEAITNPKEGTILTVLRSWARAFSEASRKSEDFSLMFTHALAAAKDALVRTKDKLPSLKKAGVVDAGAQGFVHLIEGIDHFMNAGNIREVEERAAEIETEEVEITAGDEDITFRYCTECLIEGNEMDLPQIRSELSSYGDSLIVAGSSEKARVHIHTDNPADVFQLLGRYGTVQQPKADDMRKQFQTAHTAHGEVALVVDSACDLPPDVAAKGFIHVVPLQLTFADRTYIDKLGISSEEFYALLRERPDVIPTTSQPSGNDYRKTYTFLRKHYQRVVTVALAAALSGTFGTARAAIPDETDGIDVVDSKNVSVGIGLIVQQLAERIEAGANAEEVIAAARDLAARTRVLVAVKSVEWMVRGGRVSRTKGLLATLLGLKPIVTLDEAGIATQAGTVRGFEAGKKKIISLLGKRLPPDRPVPFAIAHVDNAEDAAWMEQQIRSRFTVGNNLFASDAAPVLATHTGFGTVAVAYIEPPAETREEA